MWQWYNKDMKKIMKTITEHNLIQNNQHIVLGLSGGPDSVCLFHVLMDLAQEMNLTIHPVHINHKFRPNAAERDQEYVEKLCADKGVRCHSFVVDCQAIADKERITSEEAGRRVRYESFSAVAMELCAGGIPKECIRIAVAQNADDQAETILFRILRGTGTDGLSGINYERTDENGFVIVRPLLDVTKAEVMDFCREKGLNPCIDHTNNQPVYTRNKIRLELIPYLEKLYNPNIRETLIRMGKAAGSDSEYIAGEAEKAFAETMKKEADDYVLLDGEKLSCYHRAIRRRTVTMALEKLGLVDDISFAHFEACEGIMNSDSPSARVDLPRGYYVTRVYRDVKFCRTDVKAGAESYEEDARALKIRIMDIEEFNGNTETNGRSRAAFDYEKMCEALGLDFETRIVSGFRAPGDYLPLGEGRRKKLQDYFIDRKIPKDERDNMKMVKIGHEVLWIMPWNDKGRFCGEYKIDKCTKKVICIESFCDS